MAGCNHVFNTPGCYSCDRADRDRKYKKMHKERERNFRAISAAADQRNADYERRHRERMAMYQQAQRPEPATVGGIPVSWILKGLAAVAVFSIGAVVLVVLIAYHVLKALLPLLLVAGIGAGLYYAYQWLVKNRPEVPPPGGEEGTFVGIPQAPVTAYPPPSPESRIDIAPHLQAPAPLPSTRLAEPPQGVTGS